MSVSTEIPLVTITSKFVQMQKYRRVSYIVQIYTFRIFQSGISFVYISITIKSESNTILKSALSGPP
jgi:hypothetical protein